MAPRREGSGSGAVPASEAARLRPLVIRTSLVRYALLAALLAALVLAFLVAKHEDVRHAPLVAPGTTGMLVLDLSASVYEGAFGQTIQKLADSDERVGVVAFSDSAYELVPPGTPGRELLPLLRYFVPTSANGTLPRNPWERFSAGTRISEGLRVAGDVLLAKHVKHGSIVLVSDLEILPDETARLGAMAADLRDEGIGLRIVPLFPTPEKLNRIREILGPSAILRGSSADAPVRAPEAHSLAIAAPWTFLLVGGLLVVLLAVNEGVLTRLELAR
jgi:hypothetical protein